MKLVVLVENHALDPKLKQEHGLSVYVEKDGFRMVYDMGENWEFEIKCTGRNQVDFMVNVPMLRGGGGYNIWEDSRYLLEMLVKNPQSIAFNHEGQDITVQECAEGEHITLFREEQMDEFIEEIMEITELTKEQIEELR